MDKESKIKTAIEFITESNLFKSSKYDILKPLMEKVLDDTITERDITNFVDHYVPLDQKNDNKEENLNRNKQIEGCIEYSFQKEGLKRIKSIKKVISVENVGLIDKIEPIELKSKINIFYGLNASGKSSLYKAICNALGHEKETLTNINEDVNINLSKCCLEVEYWEGNSSECNITWQNGETKPKSNVKIFDSDISLSLVKDDIDNTLSLAYLKQEYFQLLSEFLEKLENRLKERKSNITSGYNFLNRNLQSKLPFLFEEGKELNKENINTIEISKKERNNLEELQDECEKLQRVNFNDKIKILDNLINQIEEILRIFGEKEKIKDKLFWKYMFTEEYFEKINNLIDEYIVCRQVLEDKQFIRFKDNIPESWLKNEIWKKFIESSFDFIKSLSEKEQKEYSKKRCPYCLQELLTDKAKKLIEDYKILQRETKQNMEDINLKIDDYSNKINNVISDLEYFSEKEKTITEEIKEFSIEKTYDRKFIVSIFTKLEGAILKKDKLKYSQEDIKKVKDLFDYYLDIHDKVLEKRKKYEEMKKNKELNIKNLGIKIKPLKHKSEVVENKKELLKYIRVSNSLKKIGDITTLIIDAKAYVSRLGTDFSKKVFIKEFQKCLDKEYKNLNCCKPIKYSFSTRTEHGETKRVYRIGDKKIKEIFSEGEQKQHALADFFAQIEIENFKGVFIFDDPVTSLDEYNMEYLAERIIRIASERDSQIIIFTHNLVFLNYLLELTGEEKVKHFTRESHSIFLDPDAKLGTERDLKVKKNKINERIKSIEQKNERSVTIDEFEIRNVYDLLSGYLESFVEIEIFKSVISRYRPNIRINSLDKVKWDSNVIKEVIHLFNKTSRKGLRHSQPIGIQPPTFNGLLQDKEDIYNLISKIKK